MREETSVLKFARKTLKNPMSGQSSSIRNSQGATGTLPYPMGHFPPAGRGILISAVASFDPAPRWPMYHGARKTRQWYYVMVIVDENRAYKSPTYGPRTRRHEDIGPDLKSSRW